MLRNPHTFACAGMVLALSACASFERADIPGRDPGLMGGNGSWPVARIRGADWSAPELALSLRRDPHHGIVAEVQTVTMAEHFAGWQPEPMAGATLVDSERRRAACAIRTCILVERFTLALDDAALLAASRDGLRVVLRAETGTTVAATAPAVPVRTALSGLSPSSMRVSALR